MCPKRLCLIVNSCALSVLLICSGCGDSSGGSTSLPASPTQGTDGWVAPDVPTYSEDGNQPAKTVINFKMPTGDDGDKCSGTSRCTLIMNYNSDRLMEVVATGGGQPEGALALQWEATVNPQSSLKLSSIMSYTDDSGLGAVTAHSSDKEAQYEVKVSIVGSDSPALYFDIIVASKGGVPLIIDFEYGGLRDFQTVTAFLFKHGDPGIFPCESMIPEALPTADIQSPPKQLSQSVHFSTLPNLEAEQEQDYTVVAIGKNVTGPPLVYGCESQDVHVTLTATKKVTIHLKDLPPRWKGLYDVTTKFDLISALPDTAENVVNIILGFFTDPAGQLMAIACEFGSTEPILSDLCNAVFKTPSNPCLEDTCFTGVGLALKGLVKSLLTDLLEGTLGGDIWFTGQDIAKMLKELELGATFEFINEPQGDGFYTVDDTHAEWHSVTYRWTLGSGCDPNDESCGKHTFNIQAFQGETVTASFSGQVTYPGLEYLLTIDPHSLNIKYGKLLLYLIEKQILPRIAGDGSDGGPKVDSLDKFIMMLLGGKECLLPGGDCCDSFAVKLAGTQTGLGKDIAKAICQALVPFAVDYLTLAMASLDADTGNVFTIGTKEPCQCIDVDANMTIDGWGQVISPCHWDSVFNIGGTKVEFDNDFWGVEQE